MLRLSEKSIFRGIPIYAMNRAPLSIAFYLPALVRMFIFCHFSENTNKMIINTHYHNEYNHA